MNNHGNPRITASVTPFQGYGRGRAIFPGRFALGYRVAGPLGYVLMRCFDGCSGTGEPRAPSILYILFILSNTLLAVLGRSSDAPEEAFCGIALVPSGPIGRGRLLTWGCASLAARLLAIAPSARVPCELFGSARYGRGCGPFPGYGWGGAIFPGRLALGYCVSALWAVS